MQNVKGIFSYIKTLYRALYRGKTHIVIGVKYFWKTI